MLQCSLVLAQEGFGKKKLSKPFVIAILTALVLFPAGSVPAQEEEREMTAEEARQLAAEMKGRTLDAAAAREEAVRSIEARRATGELSESEARQASAAALLEVEREYLLEELVVALEVHRGQPSAGVTRSLAEEIVAFYVEHDALAELRALIERTLERTEQADERMTPEEARSRAAEIRQRQELLAKALRRGGEIEDPGT